MGALDAIVVVVFAAGRVWRARSQVLEHTHEVPEKVDTDEMRVFRDALEGAWKQRRWRRVLENTEVQNKQELQCFGLLRVRAASVK